METSDTGPYLCVRVSDEGGEELDHEVFRRGVSGDGGTGVGLAVATELAESLAGSSSWTTARSPASRCGSPASRSPPPRGRAWNLDQIGERSEVLRAAEPVVEPASSLSATGAGHARGGAWPTLGCLTRGG